MPKFIIITSQAGIPHSEISGRLIDQLGTRWVHLDFDGAFKRAAWEYLYKDHPGGKTDWRQVRWPDVLNNPESLVQAIWTIALSNCLTLVEETADSLPGSNFLLSMHASWYMKETTSLITFVNGEPFRDLEVDYDFKVINLIDDIYDVYQDLSQDGQIFAPAYPHSRTSAELSARVAHEITSLLQILEWRQFEFRSAQLLASSLSAGLPFMLAVKHPMNTLARLCSDALDSTAYLSHPISDIRQRGEWDTDDVLTEIQSLAAALRRVVTLFEPTAIDEMRFISEANQSGPILTRRWPEFIEVTGSPEEPIHTRPKEGSPSLIPNLFALEHALPAATIKRNQPLISGLQAAIHRQINWRDRQLVAQSSSVVVFRPYSKDNGNISGGVQAEIVAHNRLAIIERNLADQIVRESRPFAPRRGVVLYHPDSDEMRRRRKAIVAVVATYVRETRLDARNGQTTFRALDSQAIVDRADDLVRLVEQSKGANDDALGRSILHELHAHGIECDIENRHSNDKNLGESRRQEEQTNKQAELGRVARAAIEGYSDEFRAGFDDFTLSWKELVTPCRVVTSAPSRESLVQAMLAATTEVLAPAQED